MVKPVSSLYLELDVVTDSTGSDPHDNNPSMVAFKAATHSFFSATSVACVQ